MPNKAKTLIALDPPNESGNVKYRVSDSAIAVYNAGNKQDRKDFNQYAQFSRSFVGDRSFAGNRDFARTANEPILIDFYSVTDKGDEHGFVKSMFPLLLDNRSFVNPNDKSNGGFLDSSDFSRNNYLNNKNIDGFYAVIRSPWLDDNTVNERGRNNSIVIKKDGKNMIYGTKADDIINYYNENQNDVYLGGGNDTFYDQNYFNSTSTIKDFGNGNDQDKLSFSRIDTSFSLNGTTITRKWERKNSDGQILNSSTATITLEGNDGYIGKLDSNKLVKKDGNEFVQFR